MRLYSSSVVPEDPSCTDVLKARSNLPAETQQSLMLASNITNRDLLLVRLLAHALMLYVWMPDPVLRTIRLYVANMKMVLPSLVFELQVLWKAAIISVNHRITDACTEDTTSQWMRYLIVAPNGTYSIWLAVTGGVW